MYTAKLMTRKRENQHCIKSYIILICSWSIYSEYFSQKHALYLATKIFNPAHLSCHKAERETSILCSDVSVIANIKAVKNSTDIRPHRKSALDCFPIAVNVP